MHSLRSASVAAGTSFWLALLPGLVAAAETVSTARCDLSSYRVGTDVCEIGLVGGPQQQPVSGFRAEVAAGDPASPVGGASTEIYLRKGYGDVGMSIDVNAFAYDQYFARGRVEAYVGYRDRIEVRSASLPVGTPVEVTLTHTVEASVGQGMIKPGRYSEIVVIDDFFARIDVVAFNAAGERQSASDNFSFSRSPTEDYRHRNALRLNSFIGSTLIVDYAMFGVVQFFVSQPAMNIPDFTYLSHELQAGNSGHTYLGVAGADVSFVGESGAVYRAPPPVPEPATIGLLLAGLAGLGLRARRA